MTTGGAPICMWCKHLRDGMTCAAFPDGIPEDIIFSNHDHRKPYEEDHGIQFEPKDEKAQKEVEEYMKNLLGWEG
jgi:hypothetical protein